MGRWIFISNLITYEELLQRALARVSNEITIAEGSFLFDAIAPCIAELYEAYLYIEELEKRIFADTSYGEYLERRTAEHGIYRKQATFAIRKAYFDAEVPIGSMWVKEELVYMVIEKLQNDIYLLQCKQSGSIGNCYEGDLINKDGVENIKQAVLGEVVIAGENEESDEALRTRYFNSFEKETFGGNIKDYQEKIGNIEGVGQVKVYPAWNGGGTVKVRLLDTENNIPTPELIEFVQTKVDPIQNSGQGLGIAPIGHQVTVEAAEKIQVQISTHLTFKESSWQNVSQQVGEVIEAYFNELRAKWGESDCIIRISQIEARLLEIEGIIDVEETTLNGSNKNIYLTSEQVPVLLEVIHL